MAVPKARPSPPNAQQRMSLPAELRASIERGKADAEAGRTVDGADALRDLRDLAARLKAEQRGKTGA
jgi:predicted transcriptional regulator